jgi:iron complex outermembrane recepter protein
MNPSYRMTETIKSLTEGGGEFMRVALAVAVACFSLAGLTQAEDAEAAIRRPTDIPAQTLRPALQQLSKDRDLQLVFRTDVVGEIQTNGARGELTFEEALHQLLSGTGLTYRYLDDKTVTILPLPSGGERVADPEKKNAESKTADGVSAKDAHRPGSPDVPAPGFWNRFRMAQADQAKSASEASAAQSDTASAERPVALLEEVVVTAQKRIENMQEVPSSITVFSNERLEQLGATSISDYAAYIPGLTVTNGGTPGQTMITLRGIAPVGPSSTVGYYVDNTPLGATSNYSDGRAFGLDLMPYDVERVEVLRGPQGTLYGASSMGGLIKYVLRDPSLEDFDVRLSAETSTIAHADDLGWGVRAGLNAPLSPGRLGLWMSYYNQDTPGYIDNAFTGAKDENGVKQNGGRAALRWQINNNASLQVAGMWQRIDADNNATTSLTLLPTDPPTGVATHGDLTSFHPLNEFFKKNIDYYSATLDWDLGFADFVSATGYSQTHTQRNQDASFIFGFLYPLVTGGAIAEGYAPFRVTLDLDKWTQEFRLASPSGGRLEWLVGAFYTKEDNKHLQEVFALDTNRQPIAAFSPVLVRASLPSSYEEYAGFGSVTVKVSDRFDITGGVRWAKNQQGFRQITDGLPALIGPPANTPGSSSEDVVTYMVSPRFRVNEDTMIYGRVASGYRPGGPNARIVGANVPSSVDADTLKNYEVGIKTQFLEQRALINVAAFYIDWKDIQQTVSFGGFSVIDNTGDATSKGLELETLFSLFRGLRFGANVAYTNAKLTDPDQGITTASRLGNVPRWSGSATLDYAFALADKWNAHVGGGYRYVGDQPAAFAARVGGTASYIRPSYGALDLNADLTHESWTFRLFARNVTDKNAYTGGDVATNALNIPFGIELNVLQPRTVGVSVDLRF